MKNSNLEIIERLQDMLSVLKEEYERESETLYRSLPHKSFPKGAWVQKDKDFGKVEWTENNGINMSEADGYAGINLHSGSRGFSVCKRDDWSLMSSSDVEYLNNTHKICLNGEQIQEAIRLLSCSCTQISSDIVKKLKAVGNFSLNT